MKYAVALSFLLFNGMFSMSEEVASIEEVHEYIKEEQQRKIKSQIRLVSSSIWLLQNQILDAPSRYKPSDQDDMIVALAQRVAECCKQRKELQQSLEELE